MIDKELMNKIQEKLSNSGIANPYPIPVGVSNRHIHLSAADVEQLFGQGYKLTKMKDLKQTGQYAANECVTIVGPKGSISNVRILGPERDKTQVEISKTDGFALGVKAPVRESGDLAHSANICIIGPKGHVYVESQVICAKRHIHMNEYDARILNVSNGQSVSVKTIGERGLVFDQVVVRVKDSFVLEFHVDTDEANAAGLGSNDKVFIVG